MNAIVKAFLAVSLVSNILFITHFWLQLENSAAVSKNRVKNCKQFDIRSDHVDKSSLHLVQQLQYLDCDNTATDRQAGWSREKNYLIQQVNSSVAGISHSVAVKGVGKSALHSEMKIPRQTMKKKKVQTASRHSPGQAPRGLPPENIHAAVNKKSKSQALRSLSSEAVGRARKLGVKKLVWKKRRMQATGTFSPEAVDGVKKHLSKKSRKQKLPIANRLSKSDAKAQPHRLSPEIIKGVKKFVFFVGYARSGHSIIGTLMDAHPHIMISNEFNLFEQFSELDKAPRSTWRENLYNLLYRRSMADVRWSRADSNKGYKLRVNGLWQGTFDGSIEVIGDKSGDITTKAYSANEEEFLRNYQKLKSEVSVPLRIIYTVRNPFDIISTSVVIMHENRARFRELKRNFYSNSTEAEKGTVHRFDNIAVVDGNIPIFFKRIDAVVKLIEIFGRENVLDVHNCDLVADPGATLSRIFEFLGVDTTDHYLDMCAEKVFKSVARSRNMVGWTPEQIGEVESGMKNYSVLDRYSFISN